MHPYPNTKLLIKLPQLTINGQTNKLKFKTGRSKESWREPLDQQGKTGLKNRMTHYGPTGQLTRHPVGIAFLHISPDDESRMETLPL